MPGDRSRALATGRGAIVSYAQCVRDRSLLARATTGADAFRHYAGAQVPRFVRQYAFNGQVIVKEGQLGFGLFMVIRGTVQVQKGAKMGAL